MMTRNELLHTLKRMGVSPMLYNLDGEGRIDERFCLEFTNGEWYVYFIERGTKTTNERFESEEDACQFIYEQFC